MVPPLPCPGFGAALNKVIARFDEVVLGSLRNAAQTRNFKSPVAGAFGGKSVVFLVADYAGMVLFHVLEHLCYVAVARPEL